MLALTYSGFSHLPVHFGQRQDVLGASMPAIAALVLRRAYVKHIPSSPARGRSRTLVFGSGEAASVVAQTSGTADPDAENVGFYPGPNEKHAAVPAERILPASRSLIDTARAPPQQDRVRADRAPRRQHAAA